MLLVGDVSSLLCSRRWRRIIIHIPAVGRVFHAEPPGFWRAREQLLRHSPSVALEWGAPFEIEPDSERDRGRIMTVGRQIEHRLH